MVVAKTKKSAPQASAPPAGNGRKKAACPVDRETFEAHAPRSLTVVIDGKEVQADWKTFSTGSFGYFFNGKTAVKVGNVSVPVQVNLLIMAIGSKDLPPL
jgi:hypothetical protein